MIIKKSKFVRGSRSNYRNNGRRSHGYQRSNNFGSSNFNKPRNKGNPTQLLSKYLGLAKTAISTGDTIQAEYYFQYADHFSRMISEEGIKFNRNEEIKTNDITLEDNPNQNDKPTEKEISEKEKIVSDEESDISLDSVSFLSDKVSKT